MKMSSRSKTRVGSIRFADPPSLSSEALRVLRRKSKLGPSENAAIFTNKYGDYYVAGVRIGGDSAVMLSCGSQSIDRAEHLHAELEGHFLGLGVDDTIDKMSAASGSNYNFRLDSFDSLQAQVISLTASDATSYSKLKTVAAQSIKTTLSLRSRVRDAAERAQCVLKEPVPAAGYDTIFQAGLVVELVLLPYAALKDYVAAAVEGRRQY
jgi:hypothetical protein